jgi:hypothetical protein
VPSCGDEGVCTSATFNHASSVCFYEDNLTIPTTFKNKTQLGSLATIILRRVLRGHTIHFTISWHNWNTWVSQSHVLQATICPHGSLGWASPMISLAPDWSSKFHTQVSIDQRPCTEADQIWGRHRRKIWIPFDKWRLPSNLLPATFSITWPQCCKVNSSCSQQVEKFWLICYANSHSPPSNRMLHPLKLGCFSFQNVDRMVDHFWPSENYNGEDWVHELFVVKFKMWVK